MLVDLALIPVDPAVEHLVHRNLATERRGFEDREGAGQVAQPLAAAGLGVGAALDRPQPVELLDGVGVAQAQREELLALGVAQRALELLTQRQPPTVLDDQLAAAHAALAAHDRRRARDLYRLAAQRPRP